MKFGLWIYQCKNWCSSEKRTQILAAYKNKVIINWFWISSRMQINNCTYRIWVSTERKGKISANIPHRLFFVSPARNTDKCNCTWKINKIFSICLGYKLSFIRYSWNSPFSNGFIVGLLKRSSSSNTYAQ